VAVLPTVALLSILDGPSVVCPVFLLRAVALEGERQETKEICRGQAVEACDWSPKRVSFVRSLLRNPPTGE
jgi:hypothetical protein